MGSTLFRDRQARSSALAALGTLHPWAFGSLNRVDSLDSVSNYYLEVTFYTPLSSLWQHHYCVVKALWFACGLQKNVNSLMKPTSSVQQLIVHKPECSGLVDHELSGSRLTSCL